MKRLLAVMMIGLLSVVGLVRCGTESGFEAVIVAPDDKDITSPLSVSDSFVIENGLLFLVQKSSSDTDPVPGVDVHFDTSGPFPSALTATIRLCLSQWVGVGRTTCTNPSTGFTSGTVSADDVGAVRIYPRVTVSNCGTTTGEIPGSADIGAAISTDQKTWTVTYTVSC